MTDPTDFPDNTLGYRPYLSAVLIVLLALLILMARGHRGEDHRPNAQGAYSAVGDAGWTAGSRALAA